jgi:hypothetical protein
MREIDFCKDIGYTTYSMDFCAGIQNQLQQQQIEAAMRTIRGTLDTKQQEMWDKIQEAENKYARAEGQRIYKQYEEGTIRGVAYASQVSYVRDNFQKLMTEVFAKKALKPATPAELKTLDIDMQNYYQADIEKYIGEMSYLNDPDSSGDDKLQYVSDVTEYKTNAEDSQKTWQEMRDECAALVTSVYKQNGTDWSASLSAAMTKIRIQEIQSDPVGSD